MTLADRIAPHRALAALAYVAVVASLLMLTAFSILDLAVARRDLASAHILLAQLDGRAGAPQDRPLRPGSPFLEGPSMTVAGAALLQRVGLAVTEAGGTIQSSQLEVQGPNAGDGMVGLAVSAELDQPALQRVLYALESGLPYVFVETLDVQAPQTTATGDTDRLRLVLGVSGQWRAP